MTDQPGSFGKTAIGLARNPLGIIALFIVLVYGFACLLTASAGSFTAAERMPLIYFLIGFSIIVLVAFMWLVVNHGGRPFAPEDFRDEDNYVKMNATGNLMLAMARQEGVQGKIEVSDIVATIDQAQLIPKRSVTAGYNNILWVDDRPENNVYERGAFEAFGIRFTEARSTKEALSAVQSRSFAAIISDMGREEGPREGYVLLDTLRALGVTTPVFFYASSNAPEHVRETLAHGGQGCTNDPQELFQMVTRSLLQDRR